MSEATAADFAALEAKVTALETDHAALKKQVADLQAAANGDVISHEDLVALINGIDLELGNVPASTPGADTVSQDAAVAS